jgi:hypothetical protein
VRPGRGLSCRPASPWRRNRSAHLRTCRTLMPHSPAASFKVFPWASRSRARPRRVTPAGPVVERCQRSISARSCGVRTMIRADFRPRMAAPGIRDAEREEIPHRPQESPSSRRPVNSEPFLCDVVLSPAARIQLVTVRRPRARIAPRNNRASRGEDRRSRAEASRENHWHGAGIGCEDVIGGRLRSDVWQVW